MKYLFKIKKLVRDIIDILIDSLKILYFSLKNIIFYRKLSNTDLTIVTGSDYTHFESVLNLLDSIKIYEPNTNTVLYDIGFQSSQLKFLEENYKNITIKKFNFDKYPKFFSERSNGDNKLGSYAWKSAIVSETINEYGGSVLWLDAGDKVTKKLTLLRIVLTSVGLYVPKSAGRIKDWTHFKTLENFNSEGLNTNKRNLASGMIGFNSDREIAIKISNDWLEKCKLKELIAPEGSSRLNHRQDQSLLTIICYKYNIVKSLPSSHKIFGIIVHQDPGKIYLSPVKQDELKKIRDTWYKQYIDLSTNTLINAEIVFLLDFSSVNEFPARYLEKVYLIVNISKEDSNLNSKIFDRYKDYIDHILFTERDDIAKLSINKEVSKTLYNNNDLLDKVLEIVREKRKRKIP